MKEKLCVGVVGAGMISEIYLKNMTTIFPNLFVKTVAARNIEHAKARAEQFGLGYSSVEELLADPEIELVVNLTPVGAHYGVVKAALNAGKHVFTEKTLTDDLDKAAELVALAREKNLYLGGAPDTFLGAAIQTAKSVLDAGTIGEVTGFMITANRNWSILINALPFLQAKGPGMCYDYAVYHLTALVSLLGKVSSVFAYTTFPQPYKYMIPGKPHFGEDLPCPNETRVSAALRMESGVTGTVMMDGDSILQEQALFRIYGTRGVLEFGDPNQFGSKVRLVTPQRDPRLPAEDRILEPVNPYADNSRGLGVSKMAAAILENGESPVDAKLAYHVMEVLTRILESGETGKEAAVESSPC
ncbi:MAG: Gfo/Idh/MocA family oxidoreductase [Oscillospiraceae bacterium]|nr:Gfo/Idh/MocA family oxidoreductase [Oscillospiraceae bacterium]